MNCLFLHPVLSVPLRCWTIRSRLFADDSNMEEEERVQLDINPLLNVSQWCHEFCQWRSFISRRAFLHDPHLHAWNVSCKPLEMLRSFCRICLGSAVRGSEGLGWFMKPGVTVRQWHHIIKEECCSTTQNNNNRELNWPLDVFSEVSQ